MKPTVQQQKVIDAKCGNILVSAAAGSGKTSVMTERIVGRILKGELDIRNVLVMTFTDAAAKNMREKIEKNLRKSLAENKDPDKKRFISRQITYLGQSNISTIHSFCLEVIKNFYYEATDEKGDLLLEPGFRIEDPQESGLLLAGALDDLFEKEYVGCDENPESPGTRTFLLLVDAYSGFRSDRSVKDLLIQFYHFLRSMPDYKEWILQQKKILHEVIDDFDNSACYKSILANLKFRASNAREGFDGLKRLLNDGVSFYKQSKANTDKNLLATEAFYGFISYMEGMFSVLEKENIGWNELHTYFAKMPCLPKIKIKADTDSPEKIEFMNIFNRHFTELIYYTTGDFGTKAYTQEFMFARKFVFTKTKGEITAEISEMYPAIERFMDLALALDSEYTKIKQNSNMIDFSDFEHLALRILRLKSASEYYKEKFQEIYIDEYQDTSSIQEAILQLISTDNSFMVGDVKQSIYKFRHAKPQIFMGKFDLFKNMQNHPVEDTVNKAEGTVPVDKIQTSENDTDRNIESSGRVFELNRNFRSADIILEAVNEVFSRIMSQEAGEIDYNTDHAFILGMSDQDDTKPAKPEKQETETQKANQDEVKNQNSGQHGAVITEKASTGPLIEIFLTDISPKSSVDAEPNNDAGTVDEDENSICGYVEENSLPGIGDADMDIDSSETMAKDELNKYEKEALSVAIEIHRLITREGLKPGDIAILARTGAICNVFADTLAEFKIPFACDQSMEFLERYELKVIEALLYILDNPMQDIPLAGVMSSPLFECSLDEKEMLKIRIFGKGFEYFYECVQHYKDNGDNETIKQKLVEFYERIGHIRESLLHTTVSELVENIYETTGIMSYAAAMPQGADVVRSLEDFLEWVRSIDENRHSDLHSFVKLMHDIRQKSPDTSPFGAQESLSDSVKVITMHKSKGLEYEIVFLSGNNRQLSSKDTKAPILISEKLGIGFDYVNVCEQYKNPTPLIYAMKEEMRKEELAEEMRLLYVGMTRAKRRLYITGTYKSEDHAQNKGLSDAVFRVNKYIDEYIDSTNKGESSFKLPPHIVLGVKNTLEWIFMSIAGNPDIDMGVFHINSSDPMENASCERLSQGRTWRLRSVNYEDIACQAQNIVDGESQTNGADLLENDSQCSSIQNDENISERGENTTENELLKAINRKFFFDYPNPRATTAPLKISVSEIKRHEQELDEAADGTLNIYTRDGLLTSDGPSIISEDKPTLQYPMSDINDIKKTLRGINTTVRKIEDKSGKALTSPQIGIAVHNFFRYANLDVIMASPDEKTLKEQLHIMEGMNVFTREEAVELEKSIPGFEAYFNSGLARQIFTIQKERSSNVFREIPFTLKLACSEIFGDTSFADSDYTFVQGIIDCWYEDDGKAVLIDYKTDHIRGSDEEIGDILQKRYQTQMTVYAKAIRDIKGIDIKESIIWLFNAKKSFTIKEAPDGIRLV